MSAGYTNGHRPPDQPAEASGQLRLVAVADDLGSAPPRHTVSALCEEFAEVCESAVDPLEIASALEFEGMSDQAAHAKYGFTDVFALAQEMYFRVPRSPAEPPVPPPPWQVSRYRPALHGLLYGMPAVCFPAAAGLLGGPGTLITLTAALLVAWSLSQALAYLGYLRLGWTDRGQARRLLRAGLAGGLAVMLLALTTTALLSHATLPVLIFGVGEGAYMLGACVLMVLGAEPWLLVALAPGAGGSAVFLAAGRPPDLEHLAWAALALTPVLALVLAVLWTRRTGPSAGKLIDLAELSGALPAAGFGLVAAGLLAFPVVAGEHGHGGVNAGALLAALPLSLSMGAAEWSLLWYRQRTQRLLRVLVDLRVFALRARLALIAALFQYLAAAAALTAVAVLIGAATGLVHPNWTVLPQLAAYLMLGGALFLALLVQALGLRAFPLAACAVALAAEIAGRELGVFVQIVVSAELLIVMGSYAVVVLGRAVQHAY